MIRTWTLSVSGTLEEIEDTVKSMQMKGSRGTGLSPSVIATAQGSALGEPSALLQNRHWIDEIPTPYSWKDVATFSPSAAVYFMDGYSDARIRIRGSNEEIFLSFWDRNTAISASAPRVFDPRIEETMVYTPAPEPLTSHARLPEATPEAYKRLTSQHLMQVIRTHSINTVC